MQSKLRVLLVATIPDYYNYYVILLKSYRLSSLSNYWSFNFLHPIYHVYKSCEQANWNPNLVLLCMRTKYSIGHFTITFAAWTWTLYVVGANKSCLSAPFATPAPVGRNRRHTLATAALVKSAKKARAEASRIVEERRRRTVSGARGLGTTHVDENGTGMKETKSRAPLAPVSKDTEKAVVAQSQQKEVSQMISEYRFVLHNLLGYG